MVTGIVVSGIIATMLIAFYVYRRIVGGRNRWFEMIDAEGERHRIPLPPQSSECEGSVNEYFTTATIAEVKEYRDRTLPHVGWIIIEASRVSKGSLLTFHRGDKRLTILLQSDVDILGRVPLRTKLTFDIMTKVKPSLMEQEIVEIERLATAASKDALEPLIARLADERPQIRRKAITALAAIKDDRSVEPLLKVFLNDEDAGVRQLSASALGEMCAKQAVELLIAGLTKDNDFDVQAVCAWSLGKIKDNRAVPALTAALTQHYFKLKMHAAIALGEIAEKASAQPLIACLQDSNNDSKVRIASYLSLKKILSPVEISALLEKMSGQFGDHSIENRLKDEVAENVAELSTEIIFDLLEIHS